MTFRPESYAMRGIAGEVTQALEAGRIVLAFQPVVDARATGRVAFHEALLRLVRRDGSVAMAGGFLPLVEATALGRALDRHALDLALEALAATPDLRLSVNISPLTVGDALWDWTLEAAFDRDPTVTDRLIVEITESAVAPDPGAVATFVRQVQATGASVALDDFGAGAPSLRNLRDLRFDVLKIDRAFSQGIDRDPDNRACVQAIAGLGRHFEALVVAEGVETTAAAETLIGLGVDALQGHHFGQPRLATDPVARLRA